MNPIARIISLLISVVFYLILVDIIGSWLTVAGVRLPNFLYEILVAVHRIVEPILAPIRRVVPSFGGLDLSPLILLLLLQYVVAPILIRLAGGY